MNTSEQIHLIEEIVSRLSGNYVFPDVASQMEMALRTNVSVFNGLSSADFATALTKTLQSISRDKHLQVQYREKPFRDMQEDSQPTPEAIENMRQEGAVENFGFKRVEILDQNVGYIDLHGFAPPAWAGPKAAAAMTLVTDTKALIIDLRNNSGGDGDTVALLCSYFFPAQPIIHLNSIYTRTDDSTIQTWTMPDLPAPRYLDKSVYLLTSNRTFSAGEEFLYNLKHLNRATLVGEITGGGAHPVDFQRLNDPHFLIVIPVSRSINPITGTNWEGVGVTPHIQIPADQAFDCAYQKILEIFHAPVLPRSNGQKPKVSSLITPSRPSGYSQERATPLQVIV